MTEKQKGQRGEGLISLPNKGIEAFFGFLKYAKQQAADMLDQVKGLPGKDQADAVDSASYQIAKEFLLLYYTRYKKENVDHFVDFYLNRDMSRMINDQVIINIQNIQTDADENVVRRKYESGGILIPMRLAERLYEYRELVLAYQVKNGNEIDTDLEDYVDAEELAQKSIRDAKAKEKELELQKAVEVPDDVKEEESEQELKDPAK